MLECNEGRLLWRYEGGSTTMKIKVLLCDDDKTFLERLTEAVTQLPLPTGISVAITKNSHSASLSDHELSRYRIMFLDIDMPERSGMDIARRVRELHLDAIIIFVTNYPQFSLEGYEVRAFRYINDNIKMPFIAFSMPALGRAAEWPASCSPRTGWCGRSQTGCRFASCPRPAGKSAGPFSRQCRR